MQKRSKFGFSFQDQIQKVAGGKARQINIGRVDSSWEGVLIPGGDGISQNKLLSPWRKIAFLTFLIIIFAVLLLRLINLQIVEGRNNRDLADSNRIQIKIIHAPRGVIYDRTGKILAQNEPGFRLLDPIHPDKKAQYLNRDQALKLEIGNDPSFKNLEVDSLRTYALKEKTAHILGYVGEISAEELKNPKFEGYKGGDKIGRGGIEESYEKILKGVDGGEVVEVDSSGKKVRTLTKTDPTAGQNLYLTIDADLQTLAYDQLEQATKKVNSCCGAVVAEDPNTGQILALASYPSFDPKDISMALTGGYSPILNRAIGGMYAPGSTFKIASSLAGLSSGKISKTTVFQDTGVIHLGEFSFANWAFNSSGHTDGLVDIIKAIQRSNDIYFYLLGQTVGVEVLADTAKKLGLGKPLGIDIPGESAGLIPTDQWKRDTFDEVWYPGDTLHMVIGQGYVLATPLQITNLISTVAVDGKYYPPHLALKITDPWGGEIKSFSFDSFQPNFKPGDVALVKQGLSLVPKAGGTAWPMFNFPIETAGKTGTAEFGVEKKTHAWYTGYGPLDKPTIAATALIEAGGEGSTISVPIVRELFRYQFSPNKTALIKDQAPIVATSSARVLGE